MDDDDDRASSTSSGAAAAASAYASTDGGAAARLAEAKAQRRVRFANEQRDRMETELRRKLAGAERMRVQARTERCRPDYGPMTA